LIDATQTTGLEADEDLAGTRRRRLPGAGAGAGVLKRALPG
jgi:hypothetical protein